jgi:acyl-[acyl carrier protein]--UDP-N-acetylglucosamine O-acyltransferase
VTWLSLIDCGHISSADFLGGMSRLHSFVALGTKIVSGDLTPILNNKTIRYVAVDNARDYRPKATAVEEAIRARDIAS